MVRLRGAQLHRLVTKEVQQTTGMTPSIVAKLATGTLILAHHVLEHVHPSDDPAAIDSHVTLTVTRPTVDRQGRPISPQRNELHRDDVGETQHRRALDIGRAPALLVPAHLLHATLRGDQLAPIIMQPLPVRPEDGADEIAGRCTEIRRAHGEDVRTPSGIAGREIDELTGSEPSLGLATEIDAQAERGEPNSSQDDGDTRQHHPPTPRQWPLLRSVLARIMAWNAIDRTAICPLQSSHSAAMLSSCMNSLTTAHSRRRDPLSVGGRRMACCAGRGTSCAVTVPLLVSSRRPARRASRCVDRAFRRFSTSSSNSRSLSMPPPRCSATSNS